MLLTRGTETKLAPVKLRVLETWKAQSQDEVQEETKRMNHSSLNKQPLDLRNHLGIQRRETPERVDCMG